MKLSVGFGLSFLLLLMACVQAPIEDGPVRIGVIAPFTGDGASIGQGVRDGVEIAIQEVNAAGGIDGRPLEAVYEDGRCSGSAAVAAAQKLINTDKVEFIIGGVCSPETLGIAPVAEQNKVVVVSPCSSNPGVTQAGDYIFRVYPSDTLQGKFAADYMFGQGYRNVAILGCLNEWCQGISPVFKQRFADLGGSIVGEESFEVDAKDLRTQITKLKAKDPDALYFLSMTEGSIIGLRQIEEAGWDVPMLGGDGWSDPTIAASAGTAGEGARYTSVGSPLTPDFERKMKERTGDDDVIICASQSYDIAHIYANIRGTGASTSTEMKDALYRMEPYTGPSGTIAFDGNGDVTEAHYVVSEYRDGKIIRAE